MSSTISNAQQNPDVQYHNLSDLIEENSTREAKYLGFINESSLSMGLYSLSTDEIDQQEPHLLDEVYYITEGKAKLAIGEEYVEVESGSVVFVRAHIPHRFYDIEEELQVLVIFSKLEPDVSSPDWESYHINELQKERSSAENIWNKFLDEPTMRFGLYLLPEQLEGDSELNHDFDEINIVVKGRSDFTVGDKTMEVKPGSVFYVRKGKGHYFDQLKDESLDVLILFHRGSEE